MREVAQQHLISIPEKKIRADLAVQRHLRGHAEQSGQKYNNKISQDGLGLFWVDEDNSLFLRKRSLVDKLTHGEPIGRGELTMAGTG
jgi:hypothetical protein